MYRMASTITRRQCFSGRPPRPAVLPGAGNSGSRIAHSASVTDDEYTAQPCPPAAWGGHDGHGEIGDDGIVGSWSGRGLGNHRPNQEPTSSVLRDAHAAHRGSQTLSHPDRPEPPTADRPQACLVGLGRSPVSTTCQGRLDVRITKGTATAGRGPSTTPAEWAAEGRTLGRGAGLAGLVRPKCFVRHCPARGRRTNTRGRCCCPK